MKIENHKTVKIDELAEVISGSEGATWSSLWQVFYYTRLFKYVHKSHYYKIKGMYKKVTTDRSLKLLCELGYFKNVSEQVYTAKDKVLPILQAAGFVTETLPSESKGKGYINELNNTDIFIQAVKLPHFETLLYPQFKDPKSKELYLKPDALLVQVNRNKRMYKLTFLEIEAKKSDWGNYIDKKHKKYLRLAKDIGFYDYWSSVCPYFGIPKPDIETLGFSVCFIGSISKSFGYGFRFKTSLQKAIRQQQ